MDAEKVVRALLPSHIPFLRLKTVHARVGSLIINRRRDK